MREQPLPVSGMRRILPGIEDHIATKRVGERMHGLR
jgi:hypothetical protein